LLFADHKSSHGGAHSPGQRMRRLLFVRGLLFSLPLLLLRTCCFRSLFFSIMASRDYHRYHKSPEWQAKRQEAFRIHGRKCLRCGSKWQLEINHLHYRTLFREDAKFDLEVLCHSCHCLHHGAKDKKFWRRHLKSRPRVVAMTMDEFRERAESEAHRSTMGPL
jgi:hypothetical protein